MVLIFIFGTTLCSVETAHARACPTHDVRSQLIWNYTGIELQTLRTVLSTVRLLG